jgi:hypothetical protein
MDPHSSPTAAPFSDQEGDQLHAEDFAGASAIVIEMVAIFSIGVVQRYSGQLRHQSRCG